ncbi:MAG: hypothetical protein Q7K43_06540 [Candidatus Woesearchaeota archaeon]|nr:hypothetical protein [Candidatus Woesearchaeota archaeon]
MPNYNILASGLSLEEFLGTRIPDGCISSVHAHAVGRKKGENREWYLVFFPNGIKSCGEKPFVLIDVEESRGTRRKYSVENLVVDLTDGEVVYEERDTKVLLPNAYSREEIVSVLRELGSYVQVGNSLKVDYNDLPCFRWSTLGIPKEKIQYRTNKTNSRTAKISFKLRAHGIPVTIISPSQGKDLTSFLRRKRAAEAGISSLILSFKGECTSTLQFDCRVQ